MLDGVERMRERPIQDLVEGLQQLGVDAQCTAGTGCPPVSVRAAGLPSGQVLAVIPPALPSTPANNYTVGRQHAQSLCTCLHRVGLRDLLPVHFAIAGALLLP